MKSLIVALSLAGVAGIGYAGHEAPAAAANVAPAGNGSVGTAPARAYRPAWGTVRLVRRAVVEVPVQAVTETLAVPRRDRIRLRLVREARPDRIVQRTRLVGAGCVGK